MGLIDDQILEIQIRLHKCTPVKIVFHDTRTIREILSGFVAPFALAGHGLGININ